MIVFERNAVRFNFRVGAIIYRHDAVLLQSAADIDFWVVPGGRVEMGESAAEALERELREELQVEPKVRRLLWLVESFFVLDGVRFHEICMYFLAEVPPSVPDGEFDSPEAGIRLTMRWFPADSLTATNLKPD